MLIKLELDPARMELIAGFFETYLQLSAEEERELQKELKQLDPKEEESIMELTTSWHRKGREEGREEGRREGRREGRQEGAVIAQRKFICKFLHAQFGNTSKDLQEKVKRQTDVEMLDRLSDRLFATRSIDEARTVIDEILDKRS